MRNIIRTFCSKTHGSKNVVNMAKAVKLLAGMVDEERFLGLIHRLELTVDDPEVVEWLDRLRFAIINEEVEA